MSRPRCCVRPRWDDAQVIQAFEFSFCLPFSARMATGSFHYYWPEEPASDQPPCYCVLPSHLHARELSLQMGLGQSSSAEIYNVSGTLPSLFVWFGGIAAFLLAFGLGKVTRQTRVAALSAGRLTIPKAVAYFDNQLGMGRSAALRRHRPRIPKGHSGLSAPGESTEIVIPLELRAFANDPRRRMGTNEVGQARDFRKDVVVMFQETLLFYTLQAVAEQVMHCPEIMNTFFHLLLAEETGNILRYDLLCKIIDEYIHNSDPFYTRGLTLDDLNDSAPRSLCERKRVVSVKVGNASLLCFVW
eukprot:g28432.t1